MDSFYFLKNNTLVNVKNIVKFADKNKISVDLTMLDFKNSFHRVLADKDLETLINNITSKSAKLFFRIILRRDMNLFGILSAEYERKDILEIAMRDINIDGKEYFMVFYLEAKYLKELQKMYELKENM